MCPQPTEVWHLGEDFLRLLLYIIMMILLLLSYNITNQQQKKRKKRQDHDVIRSTSLSSKQMEPSSYDDN